MNAARQTDLLIVGAGPFGLAMAAYAQHIGMDHLIVGKPMDLWKSNMPQGMILRSHADWHLDPMEVHTIDRYIRHRSLDRQAVEPLSRDFYLQYVDWFCSEKGIDPIRHLVQRLDTHNGRFAARLENGASIRATNVLLALGFRYFQNIPPELAGLLPPGRFSHTCELVDFKHLQGKRCLIVGGRQSAFEWAALIIEHGADTVHVSHRHETPQFSESEWGWINTMVARFVDEPDWYRNLSGAEQSDVHNKFAQARIKLEPWLWPRVNKHNVSLWPKTRIVACDETNDRDLAVHLDNGQTLTVDHVILATGYKVDMRRVPCIAAGNIMPRLSLSDGYPVLDDQFQSSVPGLFVTSLPATKDFGPFFAFTVAVKASAKVIAKALR